MYEFGFGLALKSELPVYVMPAFPLASSSILTIEYSSKSSSLSTSIFLLPKLIKFLSYSLEGLKKASISYILKL